MMVGSVTRQANTRHAGRACMAGVSRAGVELEWFVMRYVIRFGQPGNGRYGAPVTALRPVRIW